MRPENVPNGQEAPEIVEVNALPGGGLLIKKQGRTFIDEARREQIISCTIESLAEVGFARTTLAEIAKRAGISKGVISYHFAGKRELIDQVLEKAFKQGREWMQELVQQDCTASEKLAAYIDGNISFLKSQPTYITALIEIFMNYRAEDGSLAYDGSYDETTQQFLIQVFNQGQASGEFRPFSMEVMATCIRAAVDVLPLQMQMRPDLDLDAYGAELVETFLRATRGDTPGTGT